MASAPPFDREESCNRLADLEKRIEKEQSKILPKFQKVVADVHKKYKEVFAKLMTTTNGKILHHLNMHPSMITQLSQKIVDHDVRDFRFSTRCQIMGLLMTSMETVTMGMEDLHHQGEKLLAGAKDADPVVQAKHIEILKEFRESQKSVNDEFQRRQDEFVAPNDNVHYMLGRRDDMVKEILSEDAKLWSKKPSPTPSASANLVKYYKKAITELEAHILYLLRAQFKFIFSEFELLVTPCSMFDNPLMKKIRAGHRSVDVPVVAHELFNKVPDIVETSKLDHYIADLTKGVKEMRLDYEDAYEVSTQFIERSLAANNLGGMSSAQVIREKLEKVDQIKKARVLEFQMFDCRVAASRAEIIRLREEIKKIGNKSPHVKTEAQMSREREVHLEKLVQDLISLERKKCEAVGCVCVEREKVGNATEPGLGAKTRHLDDRQKIEELLAGDEPWKEHRADFEKRVSDFLDWERKNPGKGGIEEFLKTLDLNKDS